MMQKYIKIFLVTVLILFFINFSCSEESLDNQSPYDKTQLIGYSASDSCLSRFRQYGDSAEVEIFVDSFDINITHKNAMLNCCLDSITVQFLQAGDTLKLYENEIILGYSCDCICPYEVNSTLGVAKPGAYLVEIYTYRRLVYQEWVEVPQ
jgi:hypothetical protein